MDEFITVFANAKGESDSKYCLGSDKAAKPEDLKDCFGEKNFSEESLVDIGERASGQEPNLFSAIDGIKYSELSSHFTRNSSTTEAGCNLTKGISGRILKSVSLEKSLLWGGGILTARRGFEGQFNSSSFGPGEIGGNKNEVKNATWTGNHASQIVHLKNASDAFKVFKAVHETIQATIEDIEQKIQSCLGGQESGENNTEQNATEPDIPPPTSPTCFDNVAKINDDLKEKRALLARYQKVKGWIPTSSASHPTTQFLCLPLTLL
ncbi:unnamed protein product [Trypanosoma congolense IL3000]|uniref:WGS project CAEQ00000000 data, annotated contig 49 n=1 Tax=Trypanosoma congolense (strain IL3000) TaxID=1068625 RepID=F9WGE3_TRYCI|nr:unnamed protein product [Trypanosoma congolense IL3000]